MSLLSFLKMGPITAQEQDYLKRINRGYLFLLFAHLPLILGLAYYFETSYIEGIALSLLTLSLPPSRPLKTQVRA